MSAEALREELLAAATPEARHRLLGQERFHSLDLAELLLQRSAEAQLPSPEEALRLARLAGQLAPRLTPEEAASGFLARAQCLQGNAHRLNGDLELAAEALVWAVPSLLEEADRAAFSRGLGLVRWEQGRTDEALALLSHARSLYGDEAPAERDASRLLVGVLLAELGCPRAAAETLSILPLPANHPALGARAALSLACSVLPEHPDHDAIAGSLLSHARALFPAVGDEEGVYSLFRLEARVQAKLGRREEARMVLRSLRVHYREARDLPELALATIDLLALQVAAGELPSVVAFRRDFEGFDPEDGGDLVLTALDRMFTAGAEDPWDRSWRIGAWLFRMLRFSRIRTRPIPFA